MSAPKRTAKLAPGQLATPGEARAAEVEAEKLRKRLKRINRRNIVAEFRKLPPPAETVAALLFPSKSRLRSKTLREAIYRALDSWRGEDHERDRAIADRFDVSRQHVGRLRLARRRQKRP